MPLEETLEHRLGFKGRVRDRRNGIPKIGLKEVVDMWPGYMKQEGLIPGQCIVDNRTPDNVVPKPHKVTPLTYEEKKRRDRLRGEMGDAPRGGSAEMIMPTSGGGEGFAAVSKL